MFLNDYVNGSLTTPRLGRAAVGYLSALGIACGGLTAVGTGPLTTRFGRGWAMIAGNVLFFLLPFVDMIQRASRSDVSIWGYYIAYGAARGVWESANRALSAELFPHRLEQIFALIRFGEGLAASIGFAICPCDGGEPIKTVILVCGPVSVLCYWLAEHLNGYGRASS